MLRAIVSLFFLSLPMLAMQPASGWCEQGGSRSGNIYLQRSYPSCTVTVYFAGTSTPATIFSDNSSTPLANPFTGSSLGRWTFYAADAAYDVQLSGASIATPFRIPVTLVSSSGGGGSSAFNAITSGTNTTATMTVGSGSSLVRTGSGIIDANKILGTTLTSLTGVVYMTAGVPSVATGTCNSSTVVFGDGHCDSALTSAFYQTMQANTVAQTQRSALNFSTNFTLADSASPSRTTVQLAANISVNAATATALAANPTDCSANQFANAIAANGNLTCAQPTAANLSNGTTGAGLIVLQTSPTILTPTVASFANANHDHTSSAGGGNIPYNGIASASREGDGAKVQMFTGSDPAANECAKFDANRNIVGNGSACSASPVTLTTVTYSATPVFTRSTQIQEWAITLTGNVSSSTISGAAAADIYIFNICQDGTGGRTFVWPTGFSQASVISATASACTKQTFYWSGSAAIAVTPGVSTDTLTTFPPTTFSTLPVCASALEGSVTPVTDASTTIWGQTITGGGAGRVFAYCDGTNWVVQSASYTKTGTGNLVLANAPTLSAPVIATITNTGTETLPSATGGIPIVIACGATTGTTNCANTAVGATSKVYFGAATLAASTATITISPGYTSAATFFCVGNDVTTRANPVQVVPASATTFTITNTTGAADVIQYMCVGY